MNNPIQTLEQLDTLLDTADELIRDLPMSIADQNACVDQLYALYERVEASVEKRALAVK